MIVASYKVAKACASPRNLTLFTRPFLLVSGWGLGTRLEERGEEEGGGEGRGERRGERRRKKTEREKRKEREEREKREEEEGIRNTPVSPV